MDIKNDIPSYKEHLIDKLKFPIFNAPGNHDKSGDIYESTFGSTFFYFNISSELFLFFDTELNDGSITGEQMQMLKEALVNYPSAKNILVFTHRLIWAEENPKLKHLFNDNTRSANGNNFRDEVLPLLKKFGKGKKIYLFGGSLGAAAAPFFYFEEGNFTYIATAIRDTPKDAFLKVNVEKGHLNFKAFALSLPIENYDLNYYNSLQKRNDKFSWRLVPLYLKNMIFHRYFWYGIAFLGLPMLLIYFFRRKRV